MAGKIKKTGKAGEAADKSSKKATRTKATHTKRPEKKAGEGKAKRQAKPVAEPIAAQAAAPEERVVHEAPATHAHEAPATHAGGSYVKPRGPTGMKARNIGFGVTPPEHEPAEYDAHCPFFGVASTRGRILSGTVVGAKMSRTVTVIVNRRHFLPKFERYEKRRTKLLVHNPPSVNAQVGDKVRIVETRPISKTKHFVVIERIPPQKAVPVQQMAGQRLPDGAEAGEQQTEQ